MFSFFRKSRQKPADIAAETIEPPVEQPPEDEPTQPPPRKNKRASLGEKRLPTISVTSDVARDAVSKMLPSDGQRVRKTSSSVKPCGHGTVAVAPRVPLVVRKANTSEVGGDGDAQGGFVGGRGRRRAAVYETSKDAIAVKPTTLRKGSLKFTNDDSGLAPRKFSADVPEVEHRNAQGGAKPKGGANTPRIGVNSADGASKCSDKKNLINQEAKFQSQLNDLSKQLSQRDGEASNLRFQMEELQRDVFTKTAGMERLQAELQAAHKESEYVKQRLKNLEADLEESRQKNSLISDELTKKTERFTRQETEANIRILSLDDAIKQLKAKIVQLEHQIEQLKEEKVRLEQKHKSLQTEKDDHKKGLEKTLEEVIRQKRNVDQKWRDEFEKLRTVGILKEQQLLEDFEWKLREVEKTCKAKLQEKDRGLEERLRDAYKEAEAKLQVAENMMAEVEHLKSCKLEVAKLKHQSANQSKTIEQLKDQQELMRQAEQDLKVETRKLRTLVDMEKENLQHMQLVHRQEIADKERWLHNTLEEKKTEIAIYWEEKLLHEIGRLKDELEQLNLEDTYAAMENVRRQKETEFETAKAKWEAKIEECLSEINKLKKGIDEKEEFYHNELVTQQTMTDRDILELRRIMDKIDNAHHERFEKLVFDHELEIERINDDCEKKLREADVKCQNQLCRLQLHLDQVKDQMEKESQVKIQILIEQHRAELDTQWANLIHQKSESIKLMEEEYVTKYKTLEEQFLTQQRSHEGREVELLKTIDSLRCDLEGKATTIDDLQSTVDTLEGGVQVLNQEIAQQAEQLLKNRRDADTKMRGLQDVLIKLQALQEQERDEFQAKLVQQKKQAETSFEHLQRKCTTLTKLFEEVRSRYERRESRQEDLNIISDLRQVIAEQEKDLTCINEEKRYFQMQLMKLQNQQQPVLSGDEDDFHDVEIEEIEENKDGYNVADGTNGSYQITEPFLMQQNRFSGSHPNISIPPTILECDDE